MVLGQDEHLGDAISVAQVSGNEAQDVAVPCHTRLGTDRENNT